MLCEGKSAVGPSRLRQFCFCKSAKIGKAAVYFGKAGVRASVHSHVGPVGPPARSIMKEKETFLEDIQEEYDEIREEYHRHPLLTKR